MEKVMDAEITTEDVSEIEQTIRTQRPPAGCEDDDVVGTGIWATFPEGVLVRIECLKGHRQKGHKGWHLCMFASRHIVLERDTQGIVRNERIEICKSSVVPTLMQEHRLEWQGTTYVVRPYAVPRSEAKHQ